MKLRFSRLQRLISRKDFRATYQGGKRHVGVKLLAHYRLGYADCPKLGITISRKWGKASKRNRFKRVVREAYRHLYSELPQKLELNIHPRLSFEDLSPSEVEEELKRLVKKIRDQAQPQSTKSCRSN